MRKEAVSNIDNSQNAMVATVGQVELQTQTAFVGFTFIPAANSATFAGVGDNCLTGIAKKCRGEIGFLIA